MKQCYFIHENVVVIWQTELGQELVSFVYTTGIQSVQTTDLVALPTFSDCVCSLGIVVNTANRGIIY